MWKIAAIASALIVCSMASVIVPINWPCMFGLNITSSLSPEKSYFEYRMVADDRTLHSLEYVHDGDEFYFRVVSFDLFGNYSSGNVITNQTGKCESIPDYPIYETYTGYFDYSGEPEVVECPEEGEECVKYCNDVKCLVLDDFNYIVQDINLQTKEVLTYTMKYAQKAKEFDIVTSVCPDSGFTYHDYCNESHWASIKRDCLIHVNVTSNATPDMYFEEYRMSYYNRGLYSLEYVHDGDDFYYGLIYFDALAYPTTWEVLTNMSGDCKIREDVSVADLYEFYDSSFDYYGDSVTVDCPDGTKNCTKYCSVIRCLVLDSNSRLVQDIKFDTQEELTYTYLEDLPTVDMFSMECEGVKYTAVDVCTKKAATINWDCAFHINVTNNVTTNYHDEYRMYKGDRVAYAYHNIYNEDGYYYELAVFDPEEPEIFDYTVFSNWSGECEEMFAIGTDEIYESEFVYFHDPENVDCPDGSKGCTKYCSFIQCIVLDKNNRLLKEIQVRSELELTYTYLDDIPSVDQFSLECEGSKFKPTDYCPSSSSVKPTPSSQTSGASITKAAFTVVIASLLALLL